MEVWRESDNLERNSEGKHLKVTVFRLAVGLNTGAVEGQSMSVGDNRWLQSRRARIPGARSPRLFNFLRQRQLSWILSVELDSCHSSGVYSFKVAAIQAVFKIRPNIYYKGFILQHFKHCPYKVVTSIGDTPFPTFLPLLECFLERNFCDGAQFSYRIFLNLRAFKKRPNFLNSAPTSTEGALRLLSTPSGRFWQQTAICPVSLWTLVVELHPLNWARAQAVRWINLTNSALFKKFGLFLNTCVFLENFCTLAL
jgi:hypothetical protein